MNWFDVAWSFTAPAEGGLEDDPADFGGLTMGGITQELYARYRESHGLPPQSVTSSTPEDRKGAARELIWTPARCQLLHAPASLAHFDFAFNSTPNHAVRVLQAVLGIVVDGDLGPVTIDAAERRVPIMLAHDLVTARRGYHLKTTIDNPTQGRFLKGWLERCDRLEGFIARTSSVG